MRDLFRLSGRWRAWSRTRSVVVIVSVSTLFAGYLTLVSLTADAADTPLSQGRPTTASSTEEDGTPASAAVDGDADTRWSSKFSDPQWLQVDLGTAATVTRVVLQWEADATAFQIQTSSDATTWTNIYTTTTGTGGTQTLAVNGTGRYVRMYGTARATQWGYSLWEFQVFGTAGTGCGAANVAQGRPVTVSSIENADTPASAVVDGDAGTRWSSTFADPQWVQVDLGATASICQVVLRWEVAYATAFQIQVSADATNWTSIYSTTTGTGATQTLDVTGSGRYLRMYGTKRATSWGYSLWEITVHTSDDSGAPLTVDANFEGANDNSGSAPPDPEAAAGPNYIVEYDNKPELTIFTKDGTPVSTLELYTLFGNGGIPGASGDGHVIYDELAQRWVVEVSVDDGAGFAVSDSSDPTGTWTEMHKISGWADGTGMGYNADAYFLRDAGGTMIVNKRSVLDKDNSTYDSTQISQSQGGAPSLMPDSKPGDPYWSFDDGDDKILTLHKISDPLGAHDFTTYQVSVPGGPGWQNSVMSIRNNQMLVTSNHNDGVQWDLIDLSGDTPTLLQHGFLSPPPGTTLLYASGALAPNGSIGVEYLQRSPNSPTPYIAIYATGRSTTDPPNTMRPAVLIHSGVYDPGRSGDYSSVRADVGADGTAQNSFWLCNMYFQSPSIFAWGTRIAKFTVRG